MLFHWRGVSRQQSAALSFSSIMTFVFPKPSDTSDIEDDDSAASIDQFVGQSEHNIERTLSQGKSFNNESSEHVVSSTMEMMYGMGAAEVDEEIHDLNTALGKGNEDFDFRTLNHDELLTMMRGEPARETFSNIGNMSKFMYPELAKSERKEKQQAARNLKTSQVISRMEMEMEMEMECYISDPFVWSFLVLIYSSVVLCCRLFSARPYHGQPHHVCRVQQSEQVEGRA